MIEDGFILTEIARSICLSKSHAYYYIKESEKTGLIRSFCIVASKYMS
jgi:hypothetical protein